MTDKQIIRLNDKALSLSIELSNTLQELGRVASERLGYEVIADLCNGGEIELRRLMDDGVAEHDSCIRLEEIFRPKRGINYDKQSC